GRSPAAPRSPPSAGQRRQPQPADQGRGGEVAGEQLHRVQGADLVVPIGDHHQGGAGPGRRARNRRRSKVASSAQWTSSTTSTVTTRLSRCRCSRVGNSTSPRCLLV